MRAQPLGLVADDDAVSRDIIGRRLSTQGFAVLDAADGAEALELARTRQPDVMLLDIIMPKVDGLEVCRQVKSDPSLPFLPIIMVTARGDSEDVVEGLQAGADEYLAKPVDQAALIARVQSMLRIKRLQDTVQQQARRLENQAAELADWNRTLEARVAQQVNDIERLLQLQRFLSPQIAETIMSHPEARGSPAATPRWDASASRDASITAQSAQSPMSLPVYVWKLRTIKSWSPSGSGGRGGPDNCRVGGRHCSERPPAPYCRVQPGWDDSDRQQGGMTTSS